MMDRIRWNSTSSVQRAFGLNYANAKIIVDKIESLQSKKSKKFSPPSVQDVTAYMTEKHFLRQGSTLPERFINHYELCNWKYGKGKHQIKDWRRCVAQWVSSNPDEFQQDVFKGLPKGGVW